MRLTELEHVSDSRTPGRETFSFFCSGAKQKKEKVYISAQKIRPETIF